MSKRIEHPAAWQGEELLGRSDWLHKLSEQHVQELEQALGATRSLEMEAIDAEVFSLPTLGERLQGIQHSLEHGSGGAILRGFPVERFDEADARRIFWGLARHIGTPISQSATGERIFSVRDEGFGEGDARARGPNTRKRLSFHTDRCDVIGFLCLKQAKSGGENEVVSSMTLYNQVLERRPDLLAVLMQPYYYQRHNVDTGNDLPYCQQPIFSFHDGHFACNLLRVLIERAYQMPDVPAMTDQQREALDYVETLAEDESLHVRFRQQPGDILFLNNWVTLHRRSEFEDYPELERRRHLLRIWLSVPNSRPLDPAFAANYGATAAGAIRGGMRAKGG